MTPAGVARLEKRSDLLLLTLQRALKAMGGTLSLIAEFPKRPAHHAVELLGIRARAAATEA